MNTLNINALINTMEELRYPSIAGWQGMDLQLSPDLPCIEAEEQHIRCLILSLISYTAQLHAGHRQLLLLSTRSVSMSNHELRACTIDKTHKAHMLRLARLEQGI